VSARSETDAVKAARARYCDATRNVAMLREVESLAGARVCVAGFTGQVGSALVRVLAEANRTALAARPMHITGVARRERVTAPAGIDAVYADVADPNGPFTPARFTHVFYAAGVTSDYRSRPGDVIASQLVGLEAFLERAAPDCRFVFVSSARVYGRHAEDEALAEDSTAVVAPMHLDDLYDSAKRLAESLCLSHAERSDLNVTVVRPGNLYGLDSPHSATSISELVREAATTRRITLTGNPSSLRNYCCVVDLVQGLLLAATRGGPGRAYNIGSNEHLTTQELAQEIAGCFGTPIEIVGPSKATAPTYQRLALDRATSELGYAPQLSMRDVLPAVAAEMAAQLAARGTALQAQLA
jgi:nucleoside-diphosphate-sugar epimerase